MIEQELKEIWKNSSQIEKIKFDLSRLMMDLENKTTKIERVIRRRDRTEIGTAIFAIPMFALFAYEIPFPISKVGIILSMFWFGYVIYRLKSVQKYKRPADLSSSFKEQLENQKFHLQKQFHLLNTILYWYLIPPFVFFSITIYGFGDPADYGWSNWVANQIFPLSLTAKIANIVVCVLLYAAIYWMNISACRKTLSPVIKEIERVQSQLNQVN